MGLALMAEESQTRGQWLRDLRKEKGLTQKELADSAGCTEQFVSGIERDSDKSKPSGEICDAWAEVLGVPPNVVRGKFGRPDKRTSKDEADREILLYLEGASEHGKEIMRAVLKTIYDVDSRRAAGEQPDAKGGTKKARKWPRAEEKKDKANNKK